MRFRKLVEGHETPYTGVSLKTYNDVTGNVNSYRAYTLYYNKSLDCYWYTNRLGYLHVVSFSKFLDGLTKSLGFQVSLLTNKNTLKEDGSLFAVPIKEFKSVFVSQKTAENFLSMCRSKLNDVSLSNASDIIERIYNDFKEQK